MKNREKLFSYLLLSIFILSVITDWYRVLTLLNFAVLVVMLLDKMGRGIVLRETFALHTNFICLLMPLVGYAFYTYDFLLARVWVKYMLVPEETYFEFACPAVSGFVAVLCWPLSRNGASDEGPGLSKLLGRAKEILSHMPKMGVYLMVFGVLSQSFTALLPVALQFAFTLFFFAAFSGMLYVYFSPATKWKKLILILFSGAIFLNAVQSGMFTIVAYMSITLVSFFFIGKTYALWKKLSIFLSGVLLIFLLQTVKYGFRAQTWNEEFEGNKISLFFKLIGEQFTERKEQPLQEAFFPLYVRGNQGFNISLVMRRIPIQQDFDNGEHLFITFLSSFVPRVFWTDKPQAGGKFNMSYYAGFSISGWSTNVGPLGEAYGSFGVWGGIMYMIVLGLAVRWTYVVVFRIGYRIPLLIFWIPMIYYQITYSSETDTLQITNAIIKSAMFVWALYKIWPKVFGVVKNRFRPSSTQVPLLKGQVVN